jgi:hypothetical protein
VLLVVAYSRRRPAVELVLVGAAWLVFQPNAPYVLTDFIHLGLSIASLTPSSWRRSCSPRWPLGFASLLLVQLVVTRAADLQSRFVALSSILAASVGIYLGAHPAGLNRVGTSSSVPGTRLRSSGGLADPFGNRHLIGFVVLPLRLPDACVLRVVSASPRLPPRRAPDRR